MQVQASRSRITKVTYKMYNQQKDMHHNGWTKITWQPFDLINFIK